MTLMGLQSLADRAARRAHIKRVKVVPTRTDVAWLGAAYYWHERPVVRINMRARQHRCSKELKDTLAHEMAHVVMQNGKHNAKHKRITKRLMEYMQ